MKLNGTECKYLRQVLYRIRGIHSRLEVLEFSLEDNGRMRVYSCLMFASQESGRDSPRDAHGPAAVLRVRAAAGALPDRDGAGARRPPVHLLGRRARPARTNAAQDAARATRGRRPARAPPLLPRTAGRLEPRLSPIFRSDGRRLVVSSAERQLR